jgi:hypothetical protein
MLRLEVVWQQDLRRQEVDQVLWYPQRLWRQLLDVLTCSKKNNSQIKGTHLVVERMNHIFL